MRLIIVWIFKKLMKLLLRSDRRIVLSRFRGSRDWRNFGMKLMRIFPVRLMQGNNYVRLDKY
jgi:hypothetical protein